MTTFRSTEITEREYIGAAFHRAAADISMLNQLKDAKKTLPSSGWAPLSCAQRFPGYGVLDGAGFVSRKELPDKSKEKKRGNEEQYKL